MHAHRSTRDRRSAGAPAFGEAPMRRRKTDYGTILLHWLLAAAIGVALFTGLRIATEMPDQSWLNLLDAVLPDASVWVLHMQAALTLITVALAYAIYLIRSGLTRRVALDKSRLRGLVGRQQARAGAISVVLTWGLFAALLLLIGSGSALYLGILAGHTAVMMHWYATWLLLAFTVLHVMMHYRLGGLSQLLRIFRPQGLPVPPTKLDAVELLTLLVEQSERLAAGARRRRARFPVIAGAGAAVRSGLDGSSLVRSHDSVAGPGRTVSSTHPRNTTLQSNPLVVAAAVAVTCASVVVATDWLDVDRLTIHRIGVTDVPVLDGDTSDRVWRSVEPLSVMTNAGGNFDGKGETRIEIRAVHDGTWAYFLFTWEDPTRSLKQLPLIKQNDGWHLLHRRLRDRRRARIQRGQVLGAADHLERDACRRPHLSCRAFIRSPTRLPP